MANGFGECSSLCDCVCAVSPDGNCLALAELRAEIKRLTLERDAIERHAANVIWDLERERDQLRAENERLRGEDNYVHTQDVIDELVRERDQLRAENERLRVDVERLRNVDRLYMKAEGVIAHLESERDDLLLDAERYRWLRQSRGPASPIGEIWRYSAKELDVVIDAAREGE